MGGAGASLGPFPGVRLCAGLCFWFARVCESTRVACPHACECVHARARPALSARSGFNWTTGALRSAAVGVIQTQKGSHRLQPAPPLSIKADPLSPAR